MSGWDVIFMQYLLRSVREDLENLFNNPRYQDKLTARQMVEIMQEESEGYNEVWDEDDVVN